MAESDESSKVTKEIDYLIVGAGVSGSFCGYQLMNKGIQANKIQIIEKLNRIGGLLKSEIVEIEGYRIKQEEGGMRFHKYHRVYKLAEEEAIVLLKIPKTTIFGTKLSIQIRK